MYSGVFYEQIKLSINDVIVAQKSSNVESYYYDLWKNTPRYEIVQNKIKIDQWRLLKL